MFWIEQFFHLTLLDYEAVFAAITGILVLVVLLKLNRRRQFIPKKILPAAIFLYLLPIFMGLYAFFVEPNFLFVKEYSVDAPLVNLQKPIKLIVIGDLQARARYAPSYVQYLTDRVNALDGDYIVWVGDLIEDTTADLPLFAPMAGMKAKYGKIAVLGNHDYRDNVADPINENMADAVAAALDQMGFVTLRNQAVVTEMNGQKIVFGGTEDLWSQRVDFSTLNQQVAKAGGNLNILVTHQPMTVFLNHQPGLYALTLAGHCHGGQVNLLFLNPLFGLPKLPPGCSSNPQHVSGIFTEYNHTIMVTPGVGSLKIRARFLSPPEISVVNVY